MISFRWLWAKYWAKLSWLLHSKPGGSRFHSAVRPLDSYPAASRVVLAAAVPGKWPKEIPLALARWCQHSVCPHRRYFTWHIGQETRHRHRSIEMLLSRCQHQLVIDAAQWRAPHLHTCQPQITVAAVENYDSIFSWVEVVDVTCSGHRLLSNEVFTTSRRQGSTVGMCSCNAGEFCFNSQACL